MRQNKRFPRIMLLLISLLPVSAITAEKALLQQMRAGEAVLLIRHALAPGIGGPDDFKLDDCSTQRNLNEQGRVQARATGEWFLTPYICHRI